MIEIWILSVISIIIGYILGRGWISKGTIEQIKKQIKKSEEPRVVTIQTSKEKRENTGIVKETNEVMSDTFSKLLGLK